MHGDGSRARYGGPGGLVGRDRGGWPLCVFHLLGRVGPDDHAAGPGRDRRVLRTAPGVAQATLSPARREPAAPTGRAPGRTGLGTMRPRSVAVLPSSGKQINRRAAIPVAEEGLHCHQTSPTSGDRAAAVRALWSTAVASTS